MIGVRAYRRTRFWVAYIDGELLAVVVCRKGARAIADQLPKYERSPPMPRKGKVVTFDWDRRARVVTLPDTDGD